MPRKPGLHRFPLSIHRKYKRCTKKWKVLYWINWIFDINVFGSEWTWGQTHVPRQKGALKFWVLPFLRRCHQRWDLIIMVFPHRKAVQGLISTLRETERHIKHLSNYDCTLLLYNWISLTPTYIKTTHTDAYTCITDKSESNRRDRGFQQRGREWQL